MKKLLLALILFCSVAHADDFKDTYYFKYGLGVFKSAEFGSTQVKTVAVGTQFKFLSSFMEQLELGLWTDVADKHRSSGYVSYQVGVNVDTQSGFFMQSSIGPSLLTNTDVMLGGHFQFKENVAFGMVDSKGARLGFEYQHISSAGLFMPNEGRDFLLFKIALPW